MPRKITKEDRVEQSFQPALPLRPKNHLQAEYISAIEKNAIVVDTGYPGTGKTYVAARMASAWFKEGNMDTIVLSRPAVSDSNTLGYFKGTKEDKMRQWLAPVLGALKDEFSPGNLSYLIKEDVERIVFMPLEVVKGVSWKNSFVIVDEAEDCTLQELKSILTRIGVNSRILLCGDLDQSDLDESGLAQLLELRQKDPGLFKHIAHIDFNDPNAIVRSTTCKEIILGFQRLGV